MIYKRIITISTIVIFLIVAAASFLWVTKIKESEITVASEGAGEDIYGEVNQKIADTLLGKLFMFADENAAAREIEKNPYIKVNSIVKVFPDKVVVSVSERKAVFAVINGKEAYITDEEFVVLEITGAGEASGATVTRIETVNTSVDFSGAVKGEKLFLGTDGLFGYAVNIYSNIDDRLNSVEQITVVGKGGEGSERVYFDMFTGVKAEYRFSYDGSAQEDEIALARERLSKYDIDEKYASLTDKQKSEGYILVYLKDDLSIAVDYNLADR